jgi:hypothetical protein
VTSSERLVPPYELLVRVEEEPAEIRLPVRGRVESRLQSLDVGAGITKRFPDGLKLVDLAGQTINLLLPSCNLRG